MENACRTCLTDNDGSMTNIFENLIELNVPSRISQMLVDIASIQVQQNDGYSQYVCEFCLKSLNNAYDFRIQCQRSDQMMRTCKVDSVNNIVPLEFVKQECDEDIENKPQISYETEEDKSHSPDVAAILQNIKVELTEIENEKELVFSKSILPKKKSSKSKKKSCIKKPIVQMKVEEDIEQVVCKEEIGSAEIRSEKEILKKEHHLYVVNAFGKKEFPCYVCKMVLDSQTEYIIHTRTHNISSPYICRQCGKCYMQSKGLQTHYVHHTVGQRYCCEICGRRYFRSGDLKVHMRNHTGEKPYKCTICNKLFRRHLEMKRHSQSHSTIKLYTCKICGKNLSSLAYHMRMHRKERPYQCHMCEKNFVSKCDLNSHMVVHTGDKKYKCNVCGKSFGWSSGLRQHSLIHQNKRSFVCEICGKAFMHKHVMKSHMSKH